MDPSIVQSLNRWFSATGFRVDLDRLLALAPLFVIVGVIVLAWLAGRRRGRARGDSGSRRRGAGVAQQPAPAGSTGML